MRQVVSAWFNRYFSDPQAVFLMFAIAGFFVVIFYMGAMLMPLFASITIAYLLEGIAAKLERYNLPRLLSVIMVYLFFIAILLVFLFGLLPLVFEQLSALRGAEEGVNPIRQITQSFRDMVMQLSTTIPELADKKEKVEEFISSIEEEAVNRLRDVISGVVSYSLASMQSIITMVIYVVLVPILVFFFLKDKQIIISWFVSLLPKERRLATVIWHEMDIQIGNYIRGKIAEIIIVGVVSFITFYLFGLNYALLLAVLVGLSVLIPYIGAVLVTIPVLVVAYFTYQGFTATFYYLALAYLIIQILDGNVLVPLLFSEAVNLHPIAIIVAVLVFGGLWGFWGVFFAIPLATLVNALMKAWPRTGAEEEQESGSEEKIMVGDPGALRGDD